MSLYQFFASEKEMPELNNMNTGGLSYDESENISFYSNDETFVPMRILKEDDLHYARQFTDKKFINFIEWGYSDTNAKVIIQYIKILLKNSFTVSLYNTWMDEKSDVVAKRICIDELSIKDIKDIWGQEFFNENECLIVYKVR